MPYIDKPARRALDPHIAALAAALLGKKDGEVNYAITTLLNSLYFDSYARFNAAIGVLECVKLELYRRAVARYEDQKKQEHGDVYPS